MVARAKRDSNPRLEIVTRALPLGDSPCTVGRRWNPVRGTRERYPEGPRRAAGRRQTKEDGCLERTVPPL